MPAALSASAICTFSATMRAAAAARSAVWPCSQEVSCDTIPHSQHCSLQINAIRCCSQAGKRHKMYETYNCRLACTWAGSEVGSPDIASAASANRLPKLLPSHTCITTRRYETMSALTVACSFVGTPVSHPQQAVRAATGMRQLALLYAGMLVTQLKHLYAFLRMGYRRCPW